MQIGSVSNAYNPVSQVPPASSPVSQSVSQAADAATEALYALSTAMGGAADAMMNIAAGSMDSAVDIQV